MVGEDPDRDAAYEHAGWRIHHLRVGQPALSDLIAEVGITSAQG